jgi:uncharacterized membrane protein YhiD involved in acid resistance
LAAGFGLYVLSLAAMVLILLTLWLLDRLEDLLPKRRLRRVTLRRAWGVDCILETVRRFKTAGMEVIDVCFERSDALTTVDIHLSIGYKSSKRFYEFQRSIEADPEYQLMAVETA